jgi:predicted TPR repeat methyltransferase
MLEKARGRGLYDALHQRELTAFMAERPDAFDVVVSADTLVYFGELEAAMRAAARTLRPGGWLCFTVEALDEGQDGYRIQHHGRYAHSRTYLEAVLDEVGLRIAEIESVFLRNEGGAPVAGWLAVAQRPATAGLEIEAAARNGVSVYG